MPSRIHNKLIIAHIESKTNYFALFNYFANELSTILPLKCTSHPAILPTDILYTCSQWNLHGPLRDLYPRQDNLRTGSENTVLAHKSTNRRMAENTQNINKIKQQKNNYDHFIFISNMKNNLSEH